MVAVVAGSLSGDVLGRAPAEPLTEVVVTLRAPSLASVFGRSLLSASHTAYLARVDAEQAVVSRRITTTLPGSRVRWRYRLVANGLAVVVPKDELSSLARVPGVAKVWPSVRYHALASADAGSPEQIGAERLWGAGLESSGQGIKIAIIDDGIDASHPYLAPDGLSYPPGFPKGQTRFATPKVIVQRSFPPPGATNRYAARPFDPVNSSHATHVAGIAAGDHDTIVKGTRISGVAPTAWLGNYKALTTPTPGFGLDGNSPEITAAIEAAVADGMNVINLSLGEPEIEPSRDIVVQALQHAAAAGVVPVVAAGNDYADFGAGSITSPATAPAAIAVAAVDAKNGIAYFSSGGPTPISLQLKPDVSAPGVGVLSSVPGGKFETEDGTSMATPAVAGAVALLKERHPDWTVAQLHSALEQTGSAAFADSGAEALATREGGGVVDLVRADNPLLFAAPTSVSFGRVGPGVRVTRTVALTDAGGGAGEWSVATDVQQGSGTLTVPATVTVPGTLAARATGSQTTGSETGFVVLTRGTDVRRIPFWFLTSAPKLASERALKLSKPGVYSGTTVGAPSRISEYRFPTGGDTSYPGPERVYQFRVTGRPANVGFVVLSGTVVPHVTFYGSEDHLVGYTGLPIDLNPYRQNYGTPRRVAGLVLPAHGLYDVVFDERKAGGGPFTFRYWVNDVTPPKLRIVSTLGGISVAATDAGAGVDPTTIVASLDGNGVAASFRDGKIAIAATPGTHRLRLTVSDYQETKNMEDIGPILPNTTTLNAAVRVR